MSMNEVKQLDHAPRAQSTTESERDNRIRYRAGHAGHVESHFLKANSPDGAHALWIKHTLRIPEAPSEPAMAEVWAVAFAAGGACKLAEKRSFPLGDVTLSDAPFMVRTPCATLHHGRAEGQLESLGWELRYACAEQAFRPFPHASMYTGSFPRAKSLTPAPDTRVFGSFRAFGESFSLDGWRGAQGHNWGKSHAHAYAWVHANAFHDERGALLDGVWLEALTGRVRIGRALVTPWLSVAAVAIDGRLLRFDGLRALCSRRVRIDDRSYRLELAQAGARLSLEVSAPGEHFAGLGYLDPDGSQLACLNSKLAGATLHLTYDGRTRKLTTTQAALELGTRSEGHGIALLA